MEVFLEKMQQVLPVLGVDSFVQTSSTTEENTNDNLLYCNIKGLTASGFLTPNGIVVLKGSQAVLNERSSASKWPSVLNQRKQLILEERLVSENGAYVFKKDTEFSSPSSAAATIHGGSANGLTAWTDDKGIQLKKLQA